MIELRRAAAGLGALLAAVMLTGCAVSSPPAAPSTDPDPSSPPADVSADRQACEAFGDVLTILQNARADRVDGRMAEAEYQGWMRLATRNLDRIETRGEGAVSDAIAALKTIAPAIPPGTMAASTIDSDEFLNGPQLGAACRAVGSELVVEGFTGG